MLNLYKVAVTGGLSCGKSTVCQLFQQLGATVISADEIVYRLLSPECSIGQSVIALLGQEIVDKKAINRQKVAEIVFQDPEKLKRLEAILHPEVNKQIAQAYDEANLRKASSLFVAEIPLLFEASMEHDFDAVITVATDLTLAQKRFKGPQDAFNIRNAQQMSLDEKIKKSSFTLYNNGSLEELKLNVQTLFNQLKS